MPTAEQPPGEPSPDGATPPDDATDQSTGQPSGPVEPPADGGAQSGSPDLGDRAVEPAEVRWRLIARVLVGVEALVPLAFAGYGLVQLLTGTAVVLRNELMLVLLLALAGLALLFVSYAVGRGRRAVRTATLVWQVLLVLALVPAMWEAAQQTLAVVVLAVAVVTGYATVRATSDPPPPA